MTFNDLIQKLSKMMEAQTGGYSIKRVLIVLFSLAIIILEFIYVSPTNFLEIIGIDLGFVLTLLGFNKSDKITDTKTELAKLKIEKEVIIKPEV